VIKLLIVDDHTLFLEGLCGLLTAQPDFTIAAVAHDAREARALAMQTLPDVAVVDVALPGQSGIALARELARRDDHPTRVLILSAFADENRMIEALEAGALGYAHKAQSAQELAAAVRAVARGEEYLPPHASRVAVAEGLRRRRARRGHTGPLAILSGREREVFELLVQGLGNKEIASQLYISIKTVETHRAHILRKLGLHSVVGLIRFAAENALLMSAPAIPMSKAV
jgi:DNA-binding NarL/FixJ family response regulator